jgi:hypothetical protein
MYSKKRPDAEPAGLLDNIGLGSRLGIALAGIAGGAICIGAAGIVIFIRRRKVATACNKRQLSSFGFTNPMKVTIPGNRHTSAVEMT